jgi:hypothetical protein
MDLAHRLGAVLAERQASAALVAGAEPAGVGAQAGTVLGGGEEQGHGHFPSSVVARQCAMSSGCTPHSAGDGGDVELNTLGVAPIEEPARGGRK